MGTDRRIATGLAVLVLAVAALLLGGCGPGTGGTGLPPGSDARPIDAAAQAPTAQGPTAPGPGAPSPTGALPAPLPAPLPARAPDIEAPIERIDATGLAIAGRVLPAATVDLVLADGSPAPAGSARVGQVARAWFEDGRWRVALP